jgi:C1A family cysteine protease
MKRKTFFFRRILPAALTAALLLGSVPTAAEELTDGTGDCLSGELQADEDTQEEITTEETTTEETTKTFTDVLTDDESNTLSDGISDSVSDTETEDGISYIKGRPLTDEEREEQLAPMEDLQPLGETPSVISSFDEEYPAAYASNIPSYYDSRTKQVVTSVKNQGSTNACWAYVMASVLETSLLMKGLGTYDLSEEHLAYFLSNRADDPLGNTANDRNVHLTKSSSGIVDYHEGGNDYVSAVFLSTWSGMATEDQFPMYYDGVQTIDPSYAYTSAAYLEDAVFTEYDVNRVKQLIMQYGSVGVSYNADTIYYNPDTAAYSNPIGNLSINHAVTIVGWDDSYSKSNFNKASSVTEDGAWIVKNSWGDQWGDNGYFYLSYQNAKFDAVFSASAVTSQEYNNNYFYDGSSAIASLTLDTGEAVSCIYEATAGNGKAEVLGEVVTTTHSDNAHLMIQVYTDLTDPTDPTSGNPAYSSPVHYLQSYAGIETITVPEVTILPGTKYSVVVTNVGTNHVSYGVEYSTAYSWCRFEAGMEPNQGFVYMDETWDDAYGYLRVCPRLKAHTKTESYTPSITLSNNELYVLQSKTTTISASISPSAIGSSGCTYTSSNEKIAKVDSDGKITGIASGTAVITCSSKKVPGLKAACTVTVKPYAPTSVKATAKSYNKISITWSQVPGCDGYTIYRQEGSQTAKGRASVTGASNCSYVDKDVASSDNYIKPGVTYTYTVRAYKVINGKKVYSDQSVSSSATANLEKTLTTVRTSSDLYNTISWNKVSGADGYYVYRRTDGGTWVRIKTFTNGSRITCNDTKVSPLVTYQYMVKAYRLVYGKEWYSSYQCSGKVITAPASQKINSVVSKSNGLQLSWTAQNSCTGYQVYRKTANGSYKKIADLTGGTTSGYLDQTAVKGVTYTYYVRAYVKEFYGYAYSRYSTYTAVKK